MYYVARYINKIVLEIVLIIIYIYRGRKVLIHLATLLQI